MEIQCSVQIFKIYLIYFSDEIAALHDVWILGDQFLEELTGQLNVLIQTSIKEKDAPKLFLHKYFNVKTLYKGSASADLALARVLNALTEALNNLEIKFPKYLIVILKDIPDIFDDDAPVTAQEWVSYAVRQIAMEMRRKRSEVAR